MKILYLSHEPAVRGPLPKIDAVLIPMLAALGCQISRMPWGRRSDAETLDQKLVGRLEDLIRVILALIRKRYDAIYVMTALDEHGLARDIPLLLATHWFPAKKILMMHGSKTAPLAEPGHVLYKLLTLAVIRLSDAILLLSTEELESWRQFERRGRYYRVDNPFVPRGAPNGEDSKTATRKADLHPILLFAGRLIRAKGIYDLLDAMPAVIREVNCHLVIAGDGDERQGVLNAIRMADLARNISLLGYLGADELADVYRSSSVFILPTYHPEGFPTVIAEAMSYGLPIVTTCMRGARDHLQNGIHAIFVSPRDPVSLARAIITLLEAPDLRARMGRENQRKVKEFSPEVVGPRYLDAFREVIGSTWK